MIDGTYLHWAGYTIEYEWTMKIFCMKPIVWVPAHLAYLKLQRMVTLCKCVMPNTYLDVYFD